MSDAETNVISLERGLQNYSKSGNLPKEFETSKEDFLQIMREYSDLLTSKKILESIIPRHFKNEEDLLNLTTNLTYAKGENDLEALTNAISNPIWDLLDRGGKKWRPILCMLIAQAFDRTIDEVLEISAMIELIHNGSLVIDDIEDQSLVRKDKPCVHLIYGQDVAINAGFFMCYASVLEVIKVFEKKFSQEKMFRIMKIYMEEMVNIHLGQAWDINWHNSAKLNSFPTEKQYLQMTAHKTGVLARMAARFTCEVIDLNEEATRGISLFCEKIGVAFQIQDDILNLVGEEYVKTKGFYGEDIFEGKMTLIVIHCLNNATDEDKTRLLDLLRMKTKEIALIDEAINLMKKTDSINYAKNRAEALITEAWDGIKGYIPNNKFKGYLKTLSEFFIARKL